MNRFLLRLLLFSVLLFGIALGADRVLTLGLRRDPTGDYKVWNDLLDGKATADVVVYGSSRAWVHVDPKMVEDRLGVTCYNLGLDGHNFRMQYLRHQLLMRHNRKPRLIVLTLDYRTLDKRPDLFNAEQFLPYFDEPLIREATREYTGFRTIDYYLPLLRYTGYRGVMRLALENWFHPSARLPDRYKGYAGQVRPWTGEFEKARRTMKRYYQPLDTASIRIFEQFLKEMQDSGVPLLLVYPPEYIEGQQLVVNREAIFSLYRGLAARYRVPFLDYSADSLSFRKELFYNTQHLNKKGAELFTRSLVKKLCERTGFVH